MPGRNHMIGGFEKRMLGICAELGKLKPAENNIERSMWNSTE